MTQHDENVYDALEKLFHEPNRLAIMSALCAADKGLSFGELKTACGLTDGNLSRHLKALEEAGAVAIQKEFVKNKPRTTITLSPQGLTRFEQYLDTLSEVLDKARQAMPATARRAETVPGGLAVEAG